MTLCPFAVWKPVPSHSGPLVAHMGLVVHVQVGTGSCYPEFSNPANQASSTFWVSETGVLEQYVDADLIAWTEMAGNPYYCSVETEGDPSLPWTTVQMGMLARLMAWGHETYGWPLILVDHGESGITTHAHYPSGLPDPAWGGHPCPGPVRAGQLPAVVEAAIALVDAPPTPSSPIKGVPDMWYVAVTVASTDGTIPLDTQWLLGPYRHQVFDGAAAAAKFGPPADVSGDQVLHFPTPPA